MYSVLSFFYSHKHTLTDEVEGFIEMHINA